MNVFVLCTGRCGSVTFSQACKHISNFTSAHESRCHMLGDERFSYPPNHIEVDNRLSWLLGRLEEYYGDHAFYVHLRRNDKETAESYAKRSSSGIMRAYRQDIMLGLPPDTELLDVALDYCDTVNQNIAAFLQDKTHTMQFALENAQEDFKAFWKLIGAEGDLEAALTEFGITHNMHVPPPSSSERGPVVWRVLKKGGRIVKKLPSFILTA